MDYLKFQMFTLFLAKNFTRAQKASDQGGFYMEEKFTKEELDFLCEVAEDFLRKKYTDCKCTRCGNEFEFYESERSQIS